MLQNLGKTWMKLSSSSWSHSFHKGCWIPFISRLFLAICNFTCFPWLKGKVLFPSLSWDLIGTLKISSLSWRNRSCFAKVHCKAWFPVFETDIWNTNHASPCNQECNFCCYCEALPCSEPSENFGNCQKLRRSSSTHTMCPKVTQLKCW